jgi:hypothetical protein
MNITTVIAWALIFAMFAGCAVAIVVGICVGGAS